MFFISFICLFYLMVLTNCLTISKSNHRTVYDGEKYGGLSYLDDTSYNHRPRYGKRDLFHDQNRKNFDSLVLERHISKCSTRKTLWGKFKKLFHKAKKEKTKTTSTTVNYQTDNTIAAEMMMQHNYREEGKKMKGKKFRHNAKFHDPEVSVYFRGKTFRYKRDPRNSIRAAAFHKRQKAEEDQVQENPAISYVVREITVKEPLGPYPADTTEGRHLKTRSFHPLRKFKNQMRKLNQPILNIERSKQSEKRTTDAVDTMTLINPYKFKISKMSPKFCTTEQMEGYLENLNSKSVQIVSTKLPNLSEVISYSVTEAIFSSEPFLERTPHPEANSFSQVKKEQKGNEENEEQSPVTRYDRQAFVGEKIHTAVTSCENKLEMKLNRLLDMLKKRFDYNTRPGTGSIVYKPYTTSVYVASETESLSDKLTLPMNEKPKRYEQKTIGKSRHYSTKLHKTQAKGIHKQPSIGDSKNKHASSEEELTTTKRIISDLEMLDVYEQILNKMHRTNLNNMLSTAPERSSEDEKKQPQKRHIFRMDIRRTEPYQSETETAYNTLAKKIAYDDYVNGYKHYLDFQKSLNKDNFSDSIKFQAHMHHKVKDIGKFILNKIPQTDAVKKRGLLDDLEDSITTEDSWFRKYFNALLQTSAPKKYHSVQTVSLKPPTYAPKLSTTKMTTTLTEKRTETKSRADLETDDTTVPVDSKNGYDDTSVEEKVLATLEDVPSSARISVTEKMAHLKCIRSQVLEKLRENLNPIGLNNIRSKRKTTSDDRGTPIAMKRSREEIHRFNRKKRGKINVNEQKRIDYEGRENVESDETGLSTATKLFRLVHETKNEDRKDLLIKHKKYTRDPIDRCPRSGLFKKLKHIFVLHESSTVSSHAQSNVGIQRQTTTKKDKAESIVNVVEILKSLQNFSETLQPYVFKDEENYDRWYETDNNEDTTEKGSATTEHPVLNVESKPLKKMETEIKNEILRQFGLDMKNNAFPTLGKVTKYPENKAIVNEAMKSNTENKIDNINNILEEINAKPTLSQSRSTLRTGGIEQTFPEQQNHLSHKEFSKLLEKAAQAEERQKQQGRQKINRQKMILNTPTENLSARKLTWKTAIPRPSIKAEQKTTLTSYNKKPATDKFGNAISTKAHKVINPADIDFTTDEPFIKAIEAKEISYQAVNGKQKTEHKMSNDPTENWPKEYEDNADFMISKTGEIASDDTKELKKVIDNVNKLPKAFSSDIDKQYSVGSFRTQWTTVTKSYDNKEPVTNDVDALVKYVSTSNDKSTQDSRTINGEAVINSALKIMLEKVSHEDKHGLKTPSHQSDHKNKNNFGEHFEETPNKENEKETIEIGEEDQPNCDSTEREQTGYEYEDTFDSPPEQTASRYLTKTKKHPASSVRTHHGKPNYLNHSQRKKKNYPKEPYFDTYEPYKYANLRNDYIKFKLQENAAARINSERPRVPPISRKLQVNDLNSPRKILLSEYSNQRYDMATKPTKHFKELMVWNGDPLNRENDYGSKYTKYQAHDRKLDSLQREGNDMNILYIKGFSAPTQYPHEVYMPWSKQRVPIAVKPFVHNHRTVGDFERRMEGGDDRFYLSEAAYARHKAQSEAAREMQPPIYIDTTLLAYDEGDISFLLNGRLKKEHPGKKTSGSNKKLTTEKKTTRPKQFFTTPMPMTTEEFDKFLRDNALDVGSVTSPINKVQKTQNFRFDERKHGTKVKGDDFEKEHGNTNENKKHKMKSSIGKGRCNKKTKPSKEDDFEQRHYNLQNSLTKTNHDKDKVNKLEPEHYNDHVHSNGNGLGTKDKVDEANMELSKILRNEQQYKNDNKLSTEKQETHTDSEKIQYAIEHLSDKLNSHKKNEQKKVEDKKEKTHNLKKIHDLDEIQHSIEGFGTKMNEKLTTKKSEPSSIEMNVDTKLESMLNDKKNALHLIHDSKKIDESYISNKKKFPKEKILKILHSIEQDLSKSNRYGQELGKSQHSVEELRKDPNDKENAHMNKKSDTKIKEHSNTGKKTIVDQNVSNNYFTKHANNKKVLKIQAHGAPTHNSKHAKDRHIKSIIKGGLFGVQKTTANKFFKRKKSAKSSVSKSYEDDYEGDDQEEYESHCKVFIDGDHEKHRFKETGHSINSQRSKSTKNKGSGDIYIDTTVTEMPTKNTNRLSGTARIKLHRYFDPTTETNLVEYKKTFDSQTPKSGKLQPTEEQSQITKRSRTTFEPFFKERFRVVTFANVIPNALIRQNNNIPTKDPTATSFHESGDANMDVTIDTRKIAAETTRKIIDKFTKDIESMNDNKYESFPKLGADNINPMLSKHEKKEKDVIRIKDMFNPEKEPVIVPARSHVANMRNRPLKPALKHIQFSGKSYKYDVIFGDHESFTKKYPVQANEKLFTMRAEVQPHGKQLKEHSDKWLRFGNRIRKRSDAGKQSPAIKSSTRGRSRTGRKNKFKFLPAPEHKWHMSHLWAKCNSSRKKSSKIKSLPEVKWKSTATTRNYDLCLPRVDNLNDETDKDSFDYDPRDIQEDNSHEKKSKRSLPHLSLSPTPLNNVEMTSLLKHEEKVGNNVKHIHMNSRRERDAESFTVNNVGSIEVIIELQNYSQAQNEPNAIKPSVNSVNLMTSPTTPTIRIDIPLSTTVKYQIVNDSQMFVATSPKSYKMKRVFRAKFSSPVNLEYQVKTVRDVASTTLDTSREHMAVSTGTKYAYVDMENGPSPGVYVLSKGDQTSTETQYVLKPVIAIATQVPAVSRIGRIAVNTSGIAATPKSTKNIGKVTLSRDLIIGIKDILSKLLVEDNIVSAGHTISSKAKRQINKSPDTKVVNERPSKDYLFKKSDIHPSAMCAEKSQKSSLWHEIKRKLGIRSHCPCKCKLDKPMCAMCAATDAVANELIFEFENIAKYMNDHCGEIQNFFMLNPKSGKKLRDTVNVLDRQLKDYYKRLKGKCKNDSCCNNLVTYWDKRSAVKGILDIVPISNRRLNKRSPVTKNDDIDDINDILADIKKKLDHISGSKQQSPKLSKKLSLTEDKHKEVSLKENVNSDDMNDIVSDFKNKIQRISSSQPMTSSTSTDHSSKTNSDIYMEKYGSPKQQLNFEKDKQNKLLNRILCKDLTELYNDLDNVLRLNVTRNGDDRFLRKAELLKCLVENILITSEITREDPGFVVNNVKINLFSNLKEDKAGKGKQNPSIDQRSYNENFVTVRKDVFQKKTFPGRSTKFKTSTRLMNAHTNQQMLPIFTPDQSAKYIEYSEVDELKRKGLKERIQSLFANFKLKHSEEQDPSAEYCVYKNKAYKIVRPSKRHIKDCDYLTDSPTTNSMSEESWEEFLKKRTYDNNHGILIDAALKEIITTDCVSRAQEKINSRSTENSRPLDDQVKYATKSNSEKTRSYSDDLSRINDTVEKEKSIEQIVDFLILLQKILKANNLTESFHKLLTNEDPFSEEKIMKVVTPLKAAISLKELRKANENSDERKTDVTRPLFSRFYSDDRADVISTLKPDIFMKFSTSKDIGEGDINNDYLKGSRKEKAPKPNGSSTHGFTTAVFNANINNFYTVINVERTGSQPTVSTILNEYVYKIPHKSATTTTGSSKTHTALNEDLKNILSSYGLKDITPAIEQQVTVPKISGVRDLLLTILLYEAINLSKDFQKFTVPDDLFSPNVIITIGPESSINNHKVPATVVTKMSSIIQISETQPATAITSTMSVQNFEATTKKLTPKTPIEKFTEKPEHKSIISTEQTESFTKPIEALKSQTVAVATNSVTKKPLKVAEDTKLMDKSDKKSTKPTESLPQVIPQVYPWNIHVYGKKFFVPPFRGSSAAENDVNLKKFLKTFTKPPVRDTSYNMLEKLVQKMVPKKLLWPDSKVEMDLKGDPPDIAKWAKRYFKLGKTSGKHPIATSYDYRTTTPLSLVSSSKEAVKASTEDGGGYKKDKDSEECEREPSQCLCDLDATLNHILDCHRSMPADVFERFVKNITCARYREPPKNLIIDLTQSTQINQGDSVERSPRGSVKWDWIRDKRSLDQSSRFWGSKGSLEQGSRFWGNKRLLSMDSFERLFRGSDGIYRNTYKKKRRKREVDLTELNMNLMKLPTIQDTTSNLYAFAGDTVEIKCEPSPGPSRHQVLEPRDYVWQGERKTMMQHDNVVNDSDRIVLRSVQPKNMGIYNCSRDGELRRSVKLNVLSLPNFTILFLPAYETGAECHYRDLKAIHGGLPKAMADLGCAGGKLCRLRVEDPVCMKDEDNDRSALRGSAILVPEHRSVTCSTQCRRDLHCALTMLCAKNVPPLASIPVVVRDDISKRTFPVAMLNKRRWIVTHTLRRRASEASRLDFRHMLSTMVPGDVSVLLTCPAGHHLVTDKKVCEACPVNTYAEQGNNECRPCPPDHIADSPGSAECRLASFLGRYDWWSPCLAVWLASTLALAGFLCFCYCLCCCLDMRTPATSTTEKTISHAAPQTRPMTMSPSRIILAKFFRSSPPSSSKISDWHETKCGIWMNEEKRKVPPPLPSIDFE